MAQKIHGSFRDPNGFLFTQDHVLYRQINHSYKKDYKLLIESGLYERLIKSGAIVAHEEVILEDIPDPDKKFKIIKPETINFISYPYEWCFSQLKEAAILTLAIARRALDYDMSLKDSSVYNVQFKNGKAIFIDTLSFEKYQDGSPWVAYRQFCQHFLAPLALMAYRDITLNQLSRTNIDGVPLNLARKLLPVRTRLNFGLLIHIHMHAKSQQKHADITDSRRISDAKISKQALYGLFNSLISTVRKLNIRKIETEWKDYYQITNYDQDSFKTKKDIINTYINQIDPKSVWDLGANDGEFSRIASDKGINTVAFDIDPGAVENNYHKIKANKEKHLLPLILDLTNPSPALGWHHRERQSLLDRGPVELVMALALVHHLAIGNNVPLINIAEFFSDCAKNLIIEFVPKTDSQVQRLLASREDIFPNYTREGFEAAFSKKFKTISKNKIEGSQRVLYLMEKRE